MVLKYNNKRNKYKKTQDHHFRHSCILDDFNTVESDITFETLTVTVNGAFSAVDFRIFFLGTTGQL